MKLKPISTGGQGHWALFLTLYVSVCLSACNGKKEEIPVIPPLTSPLSQLYIGYGVVNVSYTRVTVQPEEGGPESEESGFADAPAGAGSGSYLRQGSVVRIIRRQQVKDQDKLESWVQIEGSGSGGDGWLRESLVDIYDSESQAYTASESMGR